jgi:ribosomal protein L11 methyltransferase
VTTRKALIEISLSGLEDKIIPSVVNLFDQWGQGGAVVEQIVGENARSSVKTYLLAEDDEGLRQIEIGLALLNQTRTPSPRGDSSPSRDFAPFGDFAPSRDSAPLGDFAGTQQLPAPQIRFLAEADWAEAWKSGYDVLRIGRRLVVRPTWRDYTPEPDDLVIALDPGMAFGSGLHPTTRLCLEALEDYLCPAKAGLCPAQAGVHPSASVLDVGTGSGILAIAAARLGASCVLAFDTDPLAVRVARENVALNQVESVVRVQARTAETSNLQAPLWDLVVANILAETIMDLGPALAASLSPGGILVASGIIAERADAVLASLHQNGLALVERRDDGDWVALIAYKTDEGWKTEDERRKTKDE